MGVRLWPKAFGVTEAETLVVAMVAVNARWCRSSPNSAAVNEAPSHRGGRNGNKGNEIKFAVTLLALACISGCTTGSVVVTGQERSPIDPDAVTLYAEPPSHYEVVGIIDTASSVFFFFDKAAEERAFAELKEQAATIGANGVTEWEVGEIVEWISMYDVNTGMTSPRRAKRITVTGTAIYVTLNSRSE